MPLPIDLTFYITLRCNAACRMCNVSASPEREEEMALVDAKSHVDEALKLGEVRNFVIQGGEPLLRPDDVCELAKYAGSRGLKTRVSTNASWGATQEEAATLARRLKQAGVIHLWISADAFHAEFVPVAAVKNALRAAMQEGMPFYVQSTYLFPETDRFGGQGVLDGALHNDLDRQTRAIQEEISELCPAGSYGWGRVIFKGRGESLKSSLGDDLARAERLLAEALDSLPNYGGRLDDCLHVTVFPGRRIEAVGREAELAPGQTVDAAVREWCSEEGIAL